MDAKTPPSPSPYSPTRRMRMRTHSFSAQNKNGEASYIPLVAFETWYPGVSGDLATHSKTKNDSDLRGEPIKN